MGPTVFHRRFRMQRDLSVSIVHTLEARDEYFQLPPDASGGPRLSMLHKCMAVIRPLTYGGATDIFLKINSLLLDKKNDLFEREKDSQISV